MGIRLFNITMARNYWFGANFKCNLDVKSITDLLTSYKSNVGLLAPTTEIVAFPSPVYLSVAQSVVSGTKVKIGSQNSSMTGNGAFTGETSVQQLKDLGVNFALVGHSERRTYYGETDENCATKVSKLQEDKDMIAVLCIGETLEERNAGKVLEVNSRQIKACVSAISDWSRVVIAYEPVWAIGTGVTATPEQAQQTHKEIRDFIASTVSSDVANNVRIVYGGSMNGANAAELLKCPDIDGGLIGGAALKD